MCRIKTLAYAIGYCKIHLIIRPQNKHTVEWCFVGYIFIFVRSMSTTAIARFARNNNLNIYVIIILILHLN